MARARTNLTLREAPAVRRIMAAVAAGRLTRGQGVAVLMEMGCARATATDLIASSFEQDWRAPRPEPTGIAALRDKLVGAAREVLALVLACLRRAGKQVNTD